MAWYRKAGEQGVAAAQYNLGVIYTNGRGVPPDLRQAYLWFQLAALQPTESKLLETAEANLASVAASMTPAQIADAQRQAAALGSDARALRLEASAEGGLRVRT